MTQQLAESVAVAHEDNGSVTARREKLGLSKAKLAALADVDRETLAKIEAGQPVTQTKAQQVEDALRTREFEYGMGAPAATVAPANGNGAETVEFTIEGDFGVRVTVKGPITDHEILRADVTEIIRSIREGREDV
jgi:DNA-binding XRE family transcriptional regulator